MMYLPIVALLLIGVPVELWTLGFTLQDAINPILWV